MEEQKKKRKKYKKRKRKIYKGPFWTFWSFDEKFGLYQTEELPDNKFTFKTFTEAKYALLDDLKRKRDVYRDFLLTAKDINKEHCTLLILPEKKNNQKI